MPITDDKVAHHIRVECDGKPSPLGCRVVDTVQRDTREACSEELERLGWRLHPDGKTLCGPCSRRERGA